VFYLVIERRFQVREAGAFILPMALAAMGAAVLNPASSKEVQALMPALQSYWLHAHVAVAGPAYAGFVAAFGASLMFLIKDGAPRRWMFSSCNLFLAFMLLLADRFHPLTHRVFNLGLVYAEGRPTGVFFPATAAGRLFLIAAIYFIIAAGLNLVRQESVGAEAGSRGRLLSIPFAPLVTLLGVIAAGLGLFDLVRLSQLDSTSLFALAQNLSPGLLAQVNPGLAGQGLSLPQAIQMTDAQAALFANPFKIIIVALVIFVGLAATAVDLKLERLREILPRAEVLDSISYLIISIAFPLMTLVILTGMVWAMKVFGKYWQWDPKETASLITWIIYTVYLHARVSLNWTPRRLAVISIIGFISVVFTYLGVNAVGQGYHTYGALRP